MEPEQREVKLQLTLPKFSGKEDCKIDFFEFMELFAVATEKYSSTAKAVLLKNHVTFPATGTFLGTFGDGGKLSDHGQQAQSKIWFTSHPPK